MEPTRICFSCGMLAKRKRAFPDSTELHEVIQRERDRGALNAIPLSNPREPRLAGPHQTQIECFARVYPLSDEFEKSNWDLLAIINKDRSGCPYWTPYQPYYSPKQHMDNFIMEQRERDRREFEQKITDQGREISERFENERRHVDRGLLLLAFLQIVLTGIAIIASLYLANIFF